MDAEMKKPDQEVSEAIVDELREEQLLTDSSLKGLAEKLAAGRMDASDWKVLFALDAAERKTDGKIHA